jgi:hypothetical protein
MSSAVADAPLLGEEVQQEKLVRPTTLALQMNNNVFEEKVDDEQIERMFSILGDELKSVFANSIERIMRALGKQICPQCVFDGHPMYAVPSTFPYFIGLDNHHHFWCKIDNNKRKFDALYAAAYAVVDRADVVAHWLSQVELHFTETLSLSSILNFAADYMEHIDSCCNMCMKDIVDFQLNAIE